MENMWLEFYVAWAIVIVAQLARNCERNGSLASHLTMYAFFRGHLEGCWRMDLYSQL